MELSFKETKPFIRFARNLTFSHNSENYPSIPYDARLFYTLNGEGTIETENKKYEMKKGTVIIINSGIKYCFVQKKEVSYAAFNFDYTCEHSDIETPVPPAFSEHQFNGKLIEHAVFTDVPELDDILYLTDMEHLEKELIKIITEYDNKLFLFRSEISGIFSSVLIKCLRRARNSKALAGTDIAGRILDYIHENFSKQLTNRMIADAFNFHPNYINRIVKEHTDMSLHRYVVHIRLSKAIDMLMEQNLSVETIANLCGFYDISHFSKCFKNITGINPSEYINSRRRQPDRRAGQLFPV